MAKRNVAAAIRTLKSAAKTGKLSLSDAADAGRVLSSIQRKARAANRYVVVTVKPRATKDAAAVGDVARRRRRKPAKKHAAKRRPRKRSR